MGLGESNRVINFEKLSSWIAEVSSKTRLSAETIGDSIKSILARFESLKEKGFDSMDNTSVNQVAKALSTIGIDLTDRNTGNMKNLGDVLDQLGSKWDSLNSRQKSYLATTLAGTYQQSNFLNLMNGYKDTLKLYEGALNSAGSAQEKFSLYQAGTEAHLAKLKEAWTNVWSNTFNSQGIKTAIDSLTDVANAVGWLVKNIGSLPTIMGAATLALTLFNKTLRENALSVGAQAIDLFNTKLRTATVTTRVFATSLETLGTTAKLAIGALGGILTGGIIMVLTMGVEKLISSAQKAEQLAEEVKARNNKSADAYSSDPSKVQSMLAQFDNLDKVKQSGQGLSLDQEHEWFQLQNDIAKMMPNLTASIDENGNSILKRGQARDKEIESIKQYITLRQSEKELDAGKTFNEQASIIKDRQQQIKVLQDKLSSGYDVNPFSDGMSNPLIELTDADKKAIELQIFGLQQDMENANQEIKKSVDGIIQNFSAMKGIKLNDSMKKTVTDMIDGLEASNIKNGGDGFKQYTSQLEMFVQEVDGLGKKSDSGFTQYQQAFKKLEGTVIPIGTADEYTKKFMKTLEDNQTALKFGYSLDAITKGYDDLVNSISKSISSLSELGNAYQKLSNGEKLGAQELVTLVAKYPELAKYVTENNDLSLKRGEIVKKVFEIEKQNQLLKIEMDKQDWQRKVDEAQREINLEVMKQQAIAQARLANSGVDQSSDSVSRQSGDSKKLQDQLIIVQEMKDKISQLTASGKALSSLNINDFITKGGSESLNLLTDLNAQLAKLDNLIKQAKDAQEGQVKGSDAYNASLEKQIKLMQQKQKLIQAELANFVLDADGNPISYNGSDLSTSKASKAHAGTPTSMTTYSGNYSDIINKASQTYGIDPAVIAGIIEKESDWNPNDEAKTSSAKGLMQLIKANRDQYGVADWRDPEQNIMGGTHLLKDLVDRFGDVATALEHYYGSQDSEANRAYSNDVLNRATKYANGQSIPQASGGGSVVGDKAVPDAYFKLKDQEAMAQKAIEDFNTSLVESKVAKYAEAIRLSENALKALEVQLGDTDKGTLAYNSNIDQQISKLKEQQDSLHQQAEEYRNQIANNTNLNDSQRQLFAQEAETLGVKWVELKKQIEDLNFSKVGSDLQSFSDKFDFLNNQLSISQAKMDAMEKGTSNYTKEMHYQIQVYQALQLTRKQEIDAIQNELKNVNLSAQARADLRKQLNEAGIAYYQLSANIKKASDEIVNQAIEAYKKGMETAKKAETDAIDAQMTAEENRHNKATRNIEDEQKRFNDAIDAKIKAMDRANATSDFNTQDKKLNDEKLKLQKEYDSLALDNSAEGKAKRLDLAKQLSDKQIEIDKLTRDRQTQLSKDNLDDQKKQYQDQVDAKKRAEDDSYNATKQSLEKQKKDREEYYDSQMNDELKFQQWRNDAMNNENKNISKAFENLKTIIQSKAQFINQTLKTNIIDQLNQIDLSAIGIGGGASSGDGGTFGGGVSTGGTGTGGAGNGVQHSQYYQYRQTINDIIWNKGEWEKAYQSGDTGTMQWLEQANSKLYQGLPAEVAGYLNGLSYKESMSWYEQNAKYHDGGVVGNEASSPIIKATNDFFNNAPNERTVKALVDEIMIPPQNIFKNFIPNMRGLINNITGSMSPATAGDVNYEINFKIGSVTGDKKGADYLMSELVNGVKKLGKL